MNIFTSSLSQPLCSFLPPLLLSFHISSPTAFRKEKGNHSQGQTSNLMQQ